MQTTQPVRWDDYEGRIRLALEGASDLADIPRVAGAGTVIERDSQAWQVMFNGLRVRANGYYGEWMTRLIANLRGFHEPQEEKVFHEVLARLEQPRSMIELGAYWAWYSLWFKSRFPGATVIAVEPDPLNLSIAAANAAENALDLKLELGAVAKCVAGPDQNPTLAIKPHCHVPVVTVSQLMARHDIDHLDLLHADIQGQEVAMLEDAASLLRDRRIGHLFISTHSDAIHGKCREILQSAGYRIIAEHTPGESYSFDGLICAVAPGQPFVAVPVATRKQSNLPKP